MKRNWNLRFSNENESLPFDNIIGERKKEVLNSMLLMYSLFDEFVDQQQSQLYVVE
jgi:hypothetical protein